MKDSRQQKDPEPGLLFPFPICSHSTSILLHECQVCATSCLESRALLPGPHIWAGDRHQLAIRIDFLDPVELAGPKAPISLVYDCKCLEESELFLGHRCYFRWLICLVFSSRWGWTKNNIRADSGWAGRGCWFPMRGSGLKIQLWENVSSVAESDGDGPSVGSHV